MSYTASLPRDELSWCYEGLQGHKKNFEKLLKGTSKNSIFLYDNPLNPPFLRGNKKLDVSF